MTILRRCSFKLLLWTLVLWFSSPAMAHVTSTGVATLDIVDGRISYRLTVLAPELPEDTGRLLAAAADGDRAAAARVAQAARDRVKFSVDGVFCEPGRISIRGSTTGDGKVVLEMALACPKTAGTLAIRDEWPALLGEHFQTVMSVWVKGRQSGEHAFAEGRREITVELTADSKTGWLSFVVMGVEHILTGADHLLFLVAMLALARGIWPIVKIVTGFTVAHSITLSLAALGLVDVPDHIVEPLIAATIVWVALENLLHPAGARWRWLVAVVFGLVHGLGFAGGLTSLGLPRDAMVRALVGFNAGVELGQLAFVAAVMPVVAWLAKPGRVPLLPQALSVAVAAAGTFWLIERLFFI
jgi:HupE / UreJ protein